MNISFLRKQLLTLYKRANAGHIGCSLSCIDLIYAAYKYKRKEVDSFILSKGHAAAALYVVLNYFGEIDDKTLETFYNEGTLLPAHPAPNKFKEIPFALGSLGHGMSIAAGIAKANKLSNNDSISFVLMSDGETNEGTTWEAMHFAVANSLDNLVVIIDKNGVQGFDYTKNVLGDTACSQVWVKIGFHVIEINGHDIQEIENAFKVSMEKNTKPKVIIANTIKGKGVSFMENTVDWHYLPMSDDQYISAINELN